ncbi:hypothetical protein SODALDRAFT_377247 [Sodiomyces alkalinus F11]|uniref:Mitochondrial zinc maintenance protein 1, mitochondrial n=1 Tax=Sodiomyces alkalinus (strain CBS 110278 / VKM F-3762 / F11) TaxID=1314773 RepID=A0A3N2Q4K4_SODAK|nr:hypothetical protein SODALDRAFT_377247 [Sodiomyces alkalinus F11]ROT41588.1 hypothetical protein SODALDRAFT_377247 [Sodiomyces alkalinus F11]
MSLAAYRNLMRAARVAFQGDERILSAARQQIRQGFREKAPLSPTDPELQPAIQQANEVATFLRQNVVQGEHRGDGTYRLRIHQDTERGDNDSIKKAGKGTTLGGGCGCS